MEDSDVDGFLHENVRSFPEDLIISTLGHLVILVYSIHMLFHQCYDHCCHNVCICFKVIPFTLAAWLFSIPDPLVGFQLHVRESTYWFYGSVLVCSIK